MDIDTKKAAIIIMLYIFFLFVIFFSALKPRIEYIEEIEYKNKIIERELGRNFESYEDYLLYRIEMER